MTSADWWVRDNAVRELLGFPVESYLPFLENALRNHEDANLRNASMDCYRALEGRALPSLFNLIRDDDPEVRLFAANLMGDIGDIKAIPPLIASMKDPDVNVRVASAEALGKIGDPSAVNPLREVLSDEPWVTMAAIKAMGDIGGQSALDVLYGCLEKEEYRGIAFEAIEKAGDERAIQRLTPFADRDDLKEFALKAIIAIAERIGIRLAPEYFVSMIALLLDLLRSPHPDIRRAALIALSWSGDPRGLPYLIDALKDEEIQEYAISGLVTIGEQGAPEIIAALKDMAQPQRYVLARILSLIGEHMALIQFSEDSDAEVRVEVALALGRIHSARAEEILSGMLQDPDDEVRLAAERALEGMGKVI